MKFDGVVGYISEKSFGGKLLYSFTLRGVDGFFRTGEEKPKFKVGSYVTFEAEKDAKGNMQVDLASISGSVRKPADEKAPSAEASKTVYVDNRQQAIHFQSAHKDAIEVAKFLVDKEMVKLPATTAKKMDAFMALVSDLTQKFFTEFESEHKVTEAAAESVDVEDEEVSYDE